MSGLFQDMLHTVVYPAANADLLWSAIAQHAVFMNVSTIDGI